jgi:hypothetical protein
MPGLRDSPGFFSTLRPSQHPPSPVLAFRWMLPWADSVRGRRPRAVRLSMAFLLAATAGLCCAGAGVPTNVVDDAAAAPPGAGPLSAPIEESGLAAPDVTQIVLRKGDRPPGGDDLAVSALGLATIDGHGQVGFPGTLAAANGPEVFVWKDDAILWRGSREETPPSPASPMIGVGDSGQFVFRAVTLSKDTVWSHHGRLLTAGDLAPDIPGGVILLSGWTTMTPDGTAHWISEFRDGPGNHGRGRVLYASADAQPANTTAVLRSGDLVDGLPLSRPSGLDFNYQVSANGEHLIQVANLDTGSTADDDILYVDGHIALREGQPANIGDHWKRFQRVAINDRGDYLAAVETDAANDIDTVIVHNGSVVMREGAEIGHIGLVPQVSVLALAIDDRGHALHLWSVQGFGKEYLFFACDASRLDRSVLLLETRKELDFGDPSTRISVDGFNDIGHGSALRLGPTDRLFAEVDLLERTPDPAPAHDEAILSIPLPSCPAVGGASDAASPAGS